MLHAHFVHAHAFNGIDRLMRKSSLSLVRACWEWRINSKCNLRSKCVCFSGQWPIRFVRLLWLGLFDLCTLIKWILWLPGELEVLWIYTQITLKHLLKQLENSRSLSLSPLEMNSINSSNMDGLHVQQQYIIHVARHTHHQFHLTTHVHISLSLVCAFWNEVLKRDEHRASFEWENQGNWC